MASVKKTSGDYDIHLNSGSGNLNVHGTYLNVDGRVSSQSPVNPTDVVTLSYLQGYISLSGGNIVIQSSSINDADTSVAVSDSSGIITTFNGVTTSVANSATYFNGATSNFNPNITLVQNVATVIDSIPMTQFRSAKYIVNVSDLSSGKFRSSEILVNHDGTASFATEYSVLLTGVAEFVTITTAVVGGTVRVYATSTSAASYANVNRVYLTV